MTQQNLYKIQSIYMASLTTNIEENTTPETTTIVSYRRNYIKKSQQITHHFTYLSYSTFCNNNNNKISQKLTTHIHIHNNIKKKSQKKMKIQITQTTTTTTTIKCQKMMRILIY